MKSVLALNLGSTTLKTALFLLHSDHSLIQALRSGEFAVPSIDFERTEQETYRAVLRSVANELALEHPPDYIVHRVVHGGELRGPIRLQPCVLEQLAAVASWAPAHQPASLELVRAARDEWPQAESWAGFDTDWHQTLPALNRILPIPTHLRSQGMRRYGFHGLAFASAFRFLQAQDPGIVHRRVVLAHLGGGSSLCAVLQGKSIDTSMELTPLSGLPMGTRSGSLDPGIVLAMQRDGLDPDRIELILNRESGLSGIAGGSGDMRALLERSDADAMLAIEFFVLRVAQGIAAMAVSLGGLDDLAFSGGVGTHSAAIRAAIAARLRCFGVALDPVANQGGNVCLDAGHSSSRVWMLKVDEEYELAASIAAL